MNAILPDVNGFARAAGWVSPLLPLLEEIPGVGIAVKTYGVGKSISDRLFLTKTESFIRGFASVADPSAGEFADEIEADDDQIHRAARAVVLSIDALTELEKAPILAYLYVAYLRGMIDLATLQRLLHAVNLSVAEDLWSLAMDLPENGSEKSEAHRRRWTAMQTLRTTGLTSYEGSSLALRGLPPSAGSEETALGKTLVAIMRDAERRMNGRGSTDSAPRS